MSNEFNAKQRTTLIVIGVSIVVVCLCVILAAWAGQSVWDNLRDRSGITTGQNGWDSATAEVTIAVSPGMAATLAQLAEQFNAHAYKTPDDSLMLVRTVSVVPEKMVEQSLANPPFQAIAPDSSLWLNQLDRLWVEKQNEVEGEALIPIGNRRFGDPVRYAASPVVIAAWESVARDLGWPENDIGWKDIQQKATADTTFKWNHPSTGHASGLLATLAEFYAGAGLTRGLTEEAATAETTLAYVRAVEATVRFYGEGEDIVVQRLAAEGRNFLDAFVAQEQVVIAWNQAQPGERLVAIYPAEGTLWADHPLALLELGMPGEAPITDNQRRTYQAFVNYLTAAEVQKQLLSTGYRPADLDIRLDGTGSPFTGDAVDWRQPQTTLQIPATSVVEVVQNVWWYTKRPTNIYLVVDTSGSMEENDKIGLTRVALRSFVDQIRGDRDQVGLITFATNVNLVRPLQPLDDAGRTQLHTAIDQLIASGNTALIDGVWEAYNRLMTEGNPESINAIVVMTDGQENSSRQSLSALQRRIQQEQGMQIVIFTIAFGSDADEKLMRSMAEMGGGQYRRATETDIEDLYKIISTYF